RSRAHERRGGAVAREAGFRRVSGSHEVSPLIKLVSRGDTTVVDAYLSPILRRYVAQVARALAPDSASSLPRRGRVDASGSERPGGADVHTASSQPGSLCSPPSPLREEEASPLVVIMSSGGLGAA